MGSVRRKRALARRLALSVLALAPLTSAAFSQATKSETRFEDWVVTCDDSSGTKRCSLSQTFTKAGTGDVVLAWIIAKGADNALRAVIYAPTQVLLDPGLTANVEGAEPMTVRFRYCALQACVAETPFSDSWLAAFRKGTDYSVTFQPVNLAPATVKGSLKGFTAAFDFFAKQ